MLGEAATATKAAPLKPNLAPLATGSKPSVRGYREDARGLTPTGVLEGAPAGKKVPAVGCRRVRSETAEYLAGQGKNVTILELRDEGAIDMEPRHRRFLLSKPEEMGVKSLLSREGLELRRREQGHGKFKWGQTQDGVGDINLVHGHTSENSLLPELQDAGLEVGVNGNSVKRGKIMGAVHDGFMTGWNILRKAGMRKESAVGRKSRSALV